MLYNKVSITLYFDAVPLFPRVLTHTLHFRHPPDPLPAPHSTGGYVPSDAVNNLPVQPTAAAPPPPSVYTGDRIATEQEQEEVRVLLNLIQSSRPICHVTSSV